MPPRPPPPNPPRFAQDPVPALAAALARRAAILAEPQTNTCRLFHGTAEGVDGLVIERLGAVLIAQLHAGRLAVDAEQARNLCVLAAERVGATAVYRKVYPKDRSTSRAVLDQQHRGATPWWGRPAPPEFAVCEAGLHFLVRPYDGYATGLFLDHRHARQRVRELAAGRRVLNLFAYTCGFTVAAARGGAPATVSVDISKKSLEWGRRNLATNGVPLDTHRFICDDAFAYYRRAARQGQRFDFIVLGPPTFARQRATRGVFSLADDLERLVAGALTLLDPDGLLHLSVNHRGTTLERLERVVTEAARAAGRTCTVIARPALPDDFCGDPDYAKSVLFRIG